MAIAEKTFNPTIIKNILQLLDRANEIAFSFQLHEHLDIPSYNDIKVIIEQEDREARSSQGTNRQSSYNYHHIIPKKGHKNQENGSQIINSCHAKDTNIKNGIIILNQQSKIRSDLYMTYPLPTNLSTNGRFFGADLNCNIIGMKQKRHNQGLNARYDGNMLPHHMILAELLYAAEMWNTNEILKKIKQDIIALFKNKPIEEIYNRECFVIVTEKGTILNPHDPHSHENIS
ncbi:MAG: hypothetical protein NZL83_04465 [Candidatus Absconditabacterales bacterium]|nr:hypothetical protein [Candidatus Absconditabacterales bacterium]